MEKQMTQANSGGFPTLSDNHTNQNFGVAPLIKSTQAQHWIQRLKVQGFWFSFNTPHIDSQHYQLKKKKVYSN